MKLIKIFFCTIFLLQGTSLWANEDFPHRSLFPKIETIELDELYNQRNDVVIFDVRSTYEFDTLHIKGAQHLSLDDREFVATLKVLRNQDNRPLIFYCNGHTCKKSYEATQKAMHGNVDKVYAYDAGIFDWTKAHPDEAVLLGTNPVNLTNLISKEKLNTHMLAPEAFGERVGNSAITLDIRDAQQKDALSLFPTRQHSVPLDNNKLKTYVEKAKNSNKTLLVYDAVGKQVRWLQYYLESEGLTDYYFMKGGAKAFLNY
jgi:rhodanese-related sulfurtransferase